MRGGDPQLGPVVDALRDDLDDTRAQLAEMQERLDFTERLRSPPRENRLREKLSGGSPFAVSARARTAHCFLATDGAHTANGHTLFVFYRDLIEATDRGTKSLADPSLSSATLFRSSALTDPRLFLSFHPSRSFPRGAISKDHLARTVRERTHRNMERRPGFRGHE